MKSVLKVFTLLVLVFGGMNLTAASEKKASEKIEGTWIYEAPSAPYDYCKGKVVFLKKEGKLEAKVKVNRNEFPVKNLKAAGNKITFDTEVDYEYVTVKLELINNVMKGKVITYDGEIPVSMKKGKKQ